MAFGVRVFALLAIGTACAAPPKPTVVSPAARPPTSVLVVVTGPLPAAGAEPPPPEAEPEPAPHVKIGKDTRVLLFGDSMVNAGLGAYLKRRVERLGGTLVTESWASSSARTWNRGARLDQLLSGNRPDVVIVALGANEVFIPYPEYTAGDIRGIVKRFGDRPCLWVGPPVWKNETGVVEVQKENSAPCQFFDSGHLKLDRQPDGIHPNSDGGRQWADAVWDAEFEAR